MLEITQKTIQNHLVNNKIELVRALGLPEKPYYNIFDSINLWEYGKADIVLIDESLDMYLIKIQAGSQVKPEHELVNLCKEKKCLEVHSKFKLKQSFLVFEKTDNLTGTFLSIAQNIKDINLIDYQFCLGSGLVFSKFNPHNYGNNTELMPNDRFKELLNDSFIISIKRNKDLLLNNKKK